MVSKSEFLNSVWEGNLKDPRLPEVGREIFKYFSSKGAMTRTQFLRFFSLCAVETDQPGTGSFVVNEPMLSNLTTNEKSCLAKHFALFDVNGDGKVDKVEFDEGYNSQLLI